MACPYFEPLDRVHPGDWLHAPRLPLIEPYRGVCRATQPFEPPEAVQRDVCNWGCARGRCDRLPADGADAVRFSVTGETPGKLQIIFVFEKNCAPVEHGVIEYPGPAPSTILEKQARAFGESWQRRAGHFQSSRGGEKVSIATESSSTSAE